MVVGSNEGAVVILDVKTANEIKIAEIYDDEHAYAVVGADWVPGKS